MSNQHAVNDNLDFDSGMSINRSMRDTRNPDPHEQAVLSAAILATTAFRLRDEQALVATMRRLTAAVANMCASRAS